MTFMWPAALWFLASIPVMVALYLWALKRRRKFVVRYSSLVLFRDVLSEHIGSGGTCHLDC